jgi:TPR repeat protein
MRIRDAFVGALAALTLGIAGQAAAPEAKDNAPSNNIAVTPQEALRSGFELYSTGDMPAALEALTFAADHGLASAQWKLAQMYAGGVGTERDDYKAFTLLDKFVNGYAEENPDEASKQYVGALVQLAAYYRLGIPNSPVVRDAPRAREYYTSAAYFRDGTAQLSLAMMYYNGEGGERDLVRAAKWAKLAADKNVEDAAVLLVDVALDLTRTNLQRVPTLHNRKQALTWAEVAAALGSIEGQALLGQIMFEGDGFVSNRVEGLMYLTIAAGRDPSAAWIADLQQRARAAVSEADWMEASQRAEAWLAAQPADVTVTATQ